MVLSAIYIMGERFYFFPFGRKFSTSQGVLNSLMNLQYIQNSIFFSLESVFGIKGERLFMVRIIFISKKEKYAQ